MPLMNSMCLIGGVWYPSPLNVGELSSGYRSQEEDGIARSPQSFDLFICFVALLMYRAIWDYAFQVK